MATISGILMSMWGILKFLVPTGVEPILFFTTFLLTAVLVFTIVQTIAFFRENRAVSAVIALVVAYFTASSVFVTIMISKLFPNIGLAMMAIIGVMLVVVFLAPEKFKEGLGISPLIGILIFLVIIWLTWIFAAPALESAGILATIQGATGFGISSEDVALVLVIIGIVAGIYFLFKGPKRDDDDEGFFKKLIRVSRR